MSLAVIAPPHPVLGCVVQMHATLDTVTDIQATFMRTQDKRTALIELTRIEARLTELRFRVLASADEIGEDTGARDTAAWVSHATRTEPATARADAVLAHRLEKRPIIAAAMRRGDATTVVITMTLEQLLTDLATAGMITDTDEGETTITAEQARRLACNAGLIPMVLNSQGQPLDIGRESRLHRPAQRKAIRLRDRHCRAEGCTIPAAWCEIHHRQPWSHGGHTTVDDGTCFCSHHHHLIHDTRYDHEWTAHGDVRFQRKR